MKKTPFLLLVLGLTLILIKPRNSETKEPSKTSLEVGFAKGDATPKLGISPIYIAGFGHNRKAGGQ